MRRLQTIIDWQLHAVAALIDRKVSVCLLVIIFLTAAYIYKDNFARARTSVALSLAIPPKEAVAFFYQVNGYWPNLHELEQIYKKFGVSRPDENKKKGIVYEYIGDGDFKLMIKPYQIGKERTVLLRIPNASNQSGRHVFWLCGKRNSTAYHKFIVNDESETTMKNKHLPNICGDW